ncbi:hypothetical protein [Hyperthermus butylicus]|nr:hypothetical protein [Hyperthermus butylicus]
MSRARLFPDAAPRVSLYADAQLHASLPVVPVVSAGGEMTGGRR